MCPELKSCLTTCPESLRALYALYLRKEPSISKLFQQTHRMRRFSFPVPDDYNSRVRDSTSESCSLQITFSVKAPGIKCPEASASQAITLSSRCCIGFDCREGLRHFLWEKQFDFVKGEVTSSSTTADELLVDIAEATDSCKVLQKGPPFGKDVNKNFAALFPGLPRGYTLKSAAEG